MTLRSSPPPSADFGRQKQSGLPIAGLKTAVWTLATVVLVLAAFVVAVTVYRSSSSGGIFTSADGEQQESTFTSSTEASTSPTAESAAQGQADPYQAPDPVGVRIPDLKVDAVTIPLGLRDDGSIEVPEQFDETGWWRGGPEPGELGPAVILGHVDSYDGPAVFYGLESLEAGDPIVIDREDGSTVTYIVERIEQHPKDDFPTEAVYGPTNEAELRLVTCGGSFDRDVRSYQDNVIVFATLEA